MSSRISMGGNRQPSTSLAPADCPYFLQTSWAICRKPLGAGIAGSFSFGAGFFSLAGVGSVSERISTAAVSFGGVISLKTICFMAAFCRFLAMIFLKLLPIHFTADQTGRGAIKHTLSNKRPKILKAPRKSCAPMIPKPKLPPAFGSLWLANVSMPQAAKTRAIAPSHLFQFRKRDRM